MSHRRTEETELILVLWAAVKGVQQFVNTADGTAQPHFDRRELLRQYQEGTQPTVPRTPQPTQESALLVLQLWLSIENGLGGISEIPNGTKLLLAANCLPFLNDTGFSLPIFGHQPFMIWEHKQLYRLVTSTFLHSDLKHLVANLGSLVQSGSSLEAKCGSTKFAVSVTSLGLAASFLDGKTFVLRSYEHGHMLRLDSVALQRYTAAFPASKWVISKGISCRLLWVHLGYALPCRCAASYATCLPVVSSRPNSCMLCCCAAVHAVLLCMLCCCACCAAARSPLVSADNISETGPQHALPLSNPCRGKVQPV